MNRTPLSALMLSASLSLLVACGDSGGTGGGAEGGGGNAAQGGGGQGGGAQGGGDQGGGGTGGSCDIPAGSLLITVTTPSDEELPCEGEDLVIDGIARFDTGLLYVDVCLPSQDCAPMEYEISAGAPEGFVIPEGTFVRATLRACGTNGAVLVRNLPMHDGLENPTADHEGLWLFSTTRSDLVDFGATEEREGITTAFDSVCFTSDIEPSSLDEVTVSFDGTSATVTVPPADEAMVTVPSGAQTGTFLVRNDSCGLRGNTGDVYEMGVFRLEAE